jgi:quinol monooxygenase YgiN
MTVAVHISPQHMTKADYERTIAQLEASGMGEPEGRLFHAAYGDDEVQMFEVWESPEHFEAHREQMFATLQATTLGPTSVEIHDLHSARPD